LGIDTGGGLKWGLPGRGTFKNAAGRAVLMVAWARKRIQKNRRKKRDLWKGEYLVPWKRFNQVGWHGQRGKIPDEEERRKAEEGEKADSGQRKNRKATSGGEGPKGEHTKYEEDRKRNWWGVTGENGLRRAT